MAGRIRRSPTCADPKQAEVLKNMLGSLDTFLGAVDPDTYRKGLPGGSDDAAVGIEEMIGGGMIPLIAMPKWMLARQRG